MSQPRCTCAGSADHKDNQNRMFVFDEETLKKICESFDKKDLAPTIGGRYGGGAGRNQKPKEEPCTRPGCVHWKPPHPCVWDLPCKADCFEAPPGIQPGRNPYMRR